VRKLVLATSGAYVRISATPFNVKNHQPVPCATGYDIPCFGRIPTVALSLINDAMKEDAEELSTKVPGFVIDKLVQDKMKKVHTMVTECRKVVTDDNSQSAFQRLDNFATAFEKLDPASIQSAEAWSQFVQQHVEDPKWQEKLHFDHVLGLFGFTDSDASFIRQKTYTETTSNGEEETKTFEQFGLRWVSKALTGFKPDGCLTDVVNLVYAMQGDPPAAPEEEEAVVRKLEQFRERLSSATPPFEQMWIPNKLVHDAETDDMLVWLLLRYIHKKMKSQLEVVVQLPQLPDQEDPLKVVADVWERLPGTTVLRDAQSKNLEALIRYHAKS
jgi:hypothetical protein